MQCLTKENTMAKLEKVVTAALLEGNIKVIDYNMFITDLVKDLDELKALIRRNGLMDSKLTKDVESKIHQLEMQATDWKTRVDIPRNKAAHIIIMLEQEQ
jgi:hypothetical protein